MFAQALCPAVLGLSQGRQQQQQVFYVPAMIPMAAVMSTYGAPVSAAPIRPVVQSLQIPNTTAAPRAAQGMVRNSPGSGRYTGTVKSFNVTTGYGFIQCPATHAKYGRDIFLHKHQAVGLLVGDEVEFGVECNGSGQPQARSVVRTSTKADASRAPSPPAGASAMAPLQNSSAPSKESALPSLLRTPPEDDMPSLASSLPCTPSELEDDAVQLFDPSDTSDSDREGHAVPNGARRSLAESVAQPVFE